MTPEELGTEVKNCFLPILRALVDNPDGIQIDWVCSNNKTLFVTIAADGGDRGKIIGREGKTAFALRQLFFNLCCRHRYRGVLEIAE